MLMDELVIEDWKQFNRVEIKLHPHVTILTGANGAGKTTISRLLARHIGWGFTELATPLLQKLEQGFVQYWSRFTALLKGKKTEDELGQQIGSIKFSDGKIVKLTVPKQNTSASYSVVHTPEIQVKGIHIPSHRVPFLYQHLPHLPASPIQVQVALDSFVGNSRSRTLSAGGESNSKLLKEVLISWGLFGYESKHIVASPAFKNYFEDFQNKLKEVLPKGLGFKEISIRPPEVVLVCDTGEFLVDACSGGISSLVDICWQLFLCTQIEKKVLVVIDEAENHLHASMQRRLLPSLIEAFPSVQFVITSHSPLIIGSVKDSNIYVLDFDGDGRVISSQLDMKERAGDAIQVLHEVLGVPFTMPVWVEDEIQKIISDYSANPSDDALKGIHKKLADKNLEKAFPIVMTQLLQDSLKT